MRSSVQDMGVKSAASKLSMRNCHTMVKEELLKFQDLTECGSQQSNIWAALNKQLGLSSGNEHIMVHEQQ